MDPNVQYRVQNNPPIPRPCVTFRNELFFKDEKFLAHAQPPSWRAIIK